MIGLQAQYHSVSMGKFEAAAKPYSRHGSTEPRAISASLMKPALSSSQSLLLLPQARACSYLKVEVLKHQLLGGCLSDWRWIICIHQSFVRI